jgi:hypothetical protein
MLKIVIFAAGGMDVALLAYQLLEVSVEPLDRGFADYQNGHEVEVGLTGRYYRESESWYGIEDVVPGSGTSDVGEMDSGYCSESLKVCA